MSSNGSSAAHGRDFDDMLHAESPEAVAAVLEGRDYRDGGSGASQRPQPGLDDDVLQSALADCALLDQSDTDNGKRLIAHFGRDLRVMKAAGIAGGDYVAWSGKHWDVDGGAAASTLLAQRVGDLIRLEADFMARSPHEERAIEAGQAAQIEYDALLASPPASSGRQEKAAAQKALKAKLSQLAIVIASGREAAEALSRRKKGRRDFGVSSKNATRVKNMLDCAAPRLRKPIEEFNADPMLIATLTHTLRFVLEQQPDPDVKRYIKVARIEPISEHRREDFVTALVPVAYDPDAKAERWRAFLERMLPSADVQRTVQQYSGLGLLTLPLQRFMFHYGEGANGKSIFLETLVRVLGKSLAVNLPTESIIGSGDKQGGSASPDIFRMLGKRMVRILELPDGKPLQSELIKKLTGSEEIPVRTLFKGFIDFQPQAKPHMSGNGLPKITDTSNGIWRRMLFVKWPVTLAEHEQRDFEAVVGELVEESAGILNWLIDGALDYLQGGLFIADSIRSDTREYREESDIVMQFFRDCVEPMPGHSVRAREMYLAFKDWCTENSKSIVFETRFGRDMKRHCKRDDGRVRSYLDVRLRDDRPRPQPTNKAPPANGMDDYVP
jgi:putative DNA primase/helicase